VAAGGGRVCGPHDWANYLLSGCCTACWVGGSFMFKTKMTGHFAREWYAAADLTNEQ